MPVRWHQNAADPCNRIKILLKVIHHLEGETLKRTSRLYPAVKILEKDLGRRGKLSIPLGGYRGRTKK
jgi:hypothetical protein